MTTRNIFCQHEIEQGLNSRVYTALSVPQVKLLRSINMELIDKHGKNAGNTRQKDHGYKLRLWLN